MADDNKATATPADDAAQSQADNDSQDERDDAQPQAGNGKAQADEPISKDEAKKLRKEAQSLRKRLEEADAKIKAADDAKLGETERLQKRLKELEEKETAWANERRERDAREEVVAALSDDADTNPYRARNPRAVYKLVKDELEFDAAGSISNLTSVLKQAKKDYPELFGRVSGSADGGKGSRSQSSGFDMNAAIRNAAGRA